MANAIAVNTSTIKAVNNAPIVTSLMSLGSIFLPRYSGVRPTIRPPMNTASRTNSSIMYNPVPTPPKTDSEYPRLTIGTRPPRPVSDWNAPLTAPQETTVVIAVNSEVRGDAEALLLALHVAAPTQARRACAAGVPWRSAR